LYQGHAIFGSQRTSPPALASYLARLNVISILLVPIMIRGKHWGQIGFEDCGNEHDWTTDEITTLRLFADVIGVAITRERSMEELLEAQSELVTTARQAGMAQIANNVLHNVGNVLNSVNVSAGLIGAKVRNSKAQGLAKAVQLMNEHAADLGDFFSRDERGKALPGYLNKLVGALAAEKQNIGEELESLSKSIDHIKEIVANQQSYSGATSLVEPVQIKDLLEDALRMNAASMARHQVRVVKEFAEVPLLLLDRHLVLQILVNLIGNAQQAMDGVPDRSHQITLRMEITEPADGSRLKIRVEDDGEGIAPQNLARLFAHGFTTRKNGHGFGLHSCALAAKEMGGTITAHSDGQGKGAAFTLELPVNPAKGIR
jgi:signal transduction histidine kinase